MLFATNIQLHHDVRLYHIYLDNNGLGECIPIITPPTGCAAILCPIGEQCIADENGIGECVSQVSCASVLCLEGTICVEDPGCG